MMKHPITLLLLLCFSVSQAQVFPIQVNPQLTAPYSPYLSDLTSPGSQRLMVQVRANDITVSNYFYKLRITIEGVGITIRTNPNFIPQALTLEGGLPQILYGEDLEEYFSPNALDFSGITTNWDTPFYQGQATAFTLTLLSPFKGKILTKLESLPQYAGKIDNFKALGKAGSGEELVKISNTLVNSAGKFTTKQIADYVKFATKNTSANKVMLGKYKEAGTLSYIKRAGNDYTYFSMEKSKWDEAYDLIGKNDDEMWKINKHFIDEQKDLGKEFYLSHEPWKAKNTEYLSKEAEYLIDIGAHDFKKINANTWEVIW